MALRVDPETWRPAGIDDMESAAWRSVKSTSNMIVDAGPGAGKTELLAQRACYLLQTRLCPAPKRILAISFKRDAARNLRLRVGDRCGSELARRFESMTFDAFAKGLVDRFLAALPQEWRPSSDYQIDFKIERNMRSLLDSLTVDECGLAEHQLQAIGEKRLYKESFIGQALPGNLAHPSTHEDTASLAIWRRLLTNPPSSLLNFQMIGRLAEMVLRVNPKVLSALRATYAFVFLDEFQDTTGIQYELTKTMFLDSSLVLTAVGDNKQKIMKWAGALDGVFETFQNDFQAKIERLTLNYRSAPELVRINTFLSHALDPKAAPQVPVDDGAGGNGECRVLLFATHDSEADWICNTITDAIQNKGLVPRDICILTRMQPDRYTFALRDALAEAGVEARVESELQDLLAEPLSLHLLDLFKISSAKRSPDAWASMMDLLLEIGGGDSERDARRIADNLTAFVNEFATALQSSGADTEGVMQLATGGMDFIGQGPFRLLYPQYRQDSNYDRVLDQFVTHMADCRDKTADWLSAISAFEGVNSVPIMTMHKSKGLEYHTVIFVGLEDSALWNFAKNAREEACGFFVAFSRARKRVIFTFCKTRPRQRGRMPVAQSRAEIGALYELLQKADISPEVMA